MDEKKKKIEMGSLMKRRKDKEKHREKEIV